MDKKNAIGTKGFMIFLIITLMIMILSCQYLNKEGIMNISIQNDGLGYYMYLPGIFIYHDTDWNFVDKYVPNNYMDKGELNFYGIGTAVLQLPFFLGAHLISYLLKYPMDGFSSLYQWGNLLSGMFYYCVGIFFVYKLISKYFSGRMAILICTIITFGTNLYNYSTREASYSHVYSFALLSLFLYYITKYEEKEKANFVQTAFIGVIAGFIFMTRITNSIFVITYILYGVSSIETLKARMKTIFTLKRMAPIIVGGFIAIIPQMAYWYSQTGSPLLIHNSYLAHVFWLQPKFMNVLFLINKGLFFWTPITFLAIIGFFFAKKKVDKLFLPLLVFMITNIYVISSWEAWNYGGCYGQRPFIDSMCVFALLLAVFLDKTKTIKINFSDKYKNISIQPVVYGCIGILIIINLINTYAYWYTVLPSEEPDTMSLVGIVTWVFNNDEYKTLKASRNGSKIATSIIPLKEAIDNGIDSNGKRTLFGGGWSRSFGPYIMMDKGKYTIFIRGEGLNNCRYGSCTDFGKKVIETFEVMREDDIIIYDIALNEVTDNMEFFVINESQEDVVIDGMYALKK